MSLDNRHIYTLVIPPHKLAIPRAPDALFNYKTQCTFNPFTTTQLSCQLQPYVDNIYPSGRVQTLKIINCVLVTSTVITPGSRAVRTQW